MCRNKLSTRCSPNISPPPDPAGAMRGLPAVHRFLSEPRIDAFQALLGNVAVKRAINDVLRAARSKPTSQPASFQTLLEHIIARLGEAQAASLVSVVNATGVLLHTNLGRAPLAETALAAMHQVGKGYSNLEYDLVEGVRGSRYAHVSRLISDATGAEDALVLNNCAAAVLLVLDTFARGREVIVSRNQLVEIGGGFRLPDVMLRSGVRLVEVGTTNKVYLSDYQAALNAQTALLLRTHQSNYEIQGFVSDVCAARLAALGKRIAIPTVEDLGGGALVDLSRYGLPHERTVLEAVADGIDLITFSGDKLLGGPQAGIIVGKKSYLARLRNNPMLRALRVDKMTLGALGATVQLYDTPSGITQIPLYRMLAATVDELESRARSYRDALHGERLRVTVASTLAYTGGGTLPLAEIPSRGFALEVEGAAAVDTARKLRSLPTPVVVRVQEGRCIFDLRTVEPTIDKQVQQMLVQHV